MSRNAKLAPSRTPKAKKNAAKPAAAEEKGDNKPATGAKRAPKQTANNEATTAPAKQNEQPKRNEGRKEQQNAAQKEMKQGAEPSQKENAPSQKDNAQPQKGNLLFGAVDAVEEFRFAAQFGERLFRCNLLAFLL